MGKQSSKEAVGVSIVLCGPAGMGIQTSNFPCTPAVVKLQDMIENLKKM